MSNERVNDHHKAVRQIQRKASTLLGSRFPGQYTALRTGDVEYVEILNPLGTTDHVAAAIKAATVLDRAGLNVRIDKGTQVVIWACENGYAA